MTLPTTCVAAQAQLPATRDDHSSTDELVSVPLTAEEPRAGAALPASEGQPGRRKGPGATRTQLRDWHCHVPASLHDDGAPDEGDQSERRAEADGRVAPAESAVVNDGHRGWCGRGPRISGTAS